MAEVKVLIEGYTTADSQATGSGAEKTCATITLVRDNNEVIIADPGVLESQDILISRLKDEGLSANDVTLVFLTHSHIDHFRNIGMFPEAKTLEYWGLWDGNTVTDWAENFSDDIKIIKTPGHSYDGLTLLVKTEAGTVAICGDIFWKEDYPVDDLYATDHKELTASRKKILKIADFIIPGHGPMFKVKKT